MVGWRNLADIRVNTYVVSGMKLMCLCLEMSYIAYCLLKYNLNKLFIARLPV